MALNLVEQKIQARINEEWMKKGVTIINPDSVRIDDRSHIAKDVTIEGPAVIINSRIGQGTQIEMGCRIVSCQIGVSNHIKQGCYLEKSVVEDEVVLGPYAHLRPESHLKSKVKIGNFVEIKKAIFDVESKASHLSYIGDAKIGKRVNLGCGFITCNYDGSPEQKTTLIEDDVFIGSDSQTVAPVTIGKGSYVASGSTVTDNVPPESLVLTRGKQITKPGYAKKYRK
jgi:bifunctional UDP-N-acetylglucosamine pyrophosphorylase/glucosamine-1-phosphate N-acetyltransferase